MNFDTIDEIQWKLTIHEVDGMNEPCHMEAFVFKKSTHGWKVISYYI